MRSAAQVCKKWDESLFTSLSVEVETGQKVLVMRIGENLRMLAFFSRFDSYVLA
jgi:hypothetical protein